jgi:hypothetical protein
LIHCVERLDVADGRHISEVIDAALVAKPAARACASAAARSVDSFKRGLTVRQLERHLWPQPRPAIKLHVCDIEIRSVRGVASLDLHLGGSTSAGFAMRRHRRRGASAT